jgi:hypothetical protein
MGPKITGQAHNIIGMPANLNHRRSNFKYVDSKQPGTPIWPCSRCREPGCRLLAKANSDGFTPPDLYKPVIGASILKTLYEHPEVIEVVHEKVLVWD